MENPETISHSAIECSASAAEIGEHLEHTGIAVVRCPLRIGEFYSLARRLGDVLRIEDIKIGVTGRGAHSSRPLDLHTDQHFVDTIAWYCVRSAVSGGATELVDARGVLHSLNPTTRNALERVVMSCPNVDDLGPPERVPLLRGTCGDERIYFAAWNVTPLPDAVENTAFKRFVAALSAAPRLAVRLEQGQCLFIDNRRIVHGRGALPSDSPRLLRRFWLASRNAPPRAQ